MATERLVTFLSGKKPEPENDDNARNILLIHLNLAVYALCFWMQQPVLPFLSKELGAEGMNFGFLQSSVSLFALLGGPLFGQIADKKGVKVSILLCQVSSLLMYFLTAMATSLPILFLSRIPAVAQHAMLCSQAGVSAASSKEGRSTALGRLSLSYGLGMIVGSPLGGVISEHFGMRFTCFIAATLTFFIIALIHFLYIDSVLNDIKDVSIKKTSSSLSIESVTKLLKIPSLRSILVTTFLFSFSVSCYRTVLTLAAIDSFKMTSQQLGFFISFNAMISLISNVFYVPLISAQFNLKAFTQILMNISITSICFLSLAFISDINYIYIVSVPLTLSSSALYILLTDSLTRTVSAENQGTAISFSHAVRSGVGIISPVFSGFMFQSLGMQHTMFFISGISSLSAVFTFFSMKEAKSQKVE